MKVYWYAPERPESSMWTTEPTPIPHEGERVTIDGWNFTVDSRVWEMVKDGKGENTVIVYLGMTA